MGDTGEKAARRWQAYQRVFDDSEDAKIVLEDLAVFCRAQESAFDPNERVHALKEGRREVWLRITQQRNLTEKEVTDLYRRRGQ